MIALKWIKSHTGLRALLVPTEGDDLPDVPHVVFAVDRETLAQNPLGVQQVLAARDYPPIPQTLVRELLVGKSIEDWRT